MEVRGPRVNEQFAGSTAQDHHPLPFNQPYGWDGAGRVLPN